MHHARTPSDGEPTIRTPCTKRWEELAGGGARRYCAECRLHVHDVAQMTRDQARELVARATERVCMRIRYDARGEPLFRAPEGARGSRLARWLVSAAVGALAACGGAASDVGQEPPRPPEPPATGGDGGEALGRVRAVEELGDVALPEDPPRTEPVEPIEKLGEIHVPEPPAPGAPPRRGE